jgi:hypothetical protein
MKTSNLLLIGIGVAAYVKRDVLMSFIDKQTNVITDKVSDYAAKQVSITPYKLPKVGFDLRKREIKLSGSINCENKSPVSLTLNSYQIEVVIENKGKGILLGKTPLLEPRVNIQSHSKTKVDYSFRIPLETASNLVVSDKEIVNSDMFIILKNLNVSGFALPVQKIAITSKWREILNIIKDPTSLLDNLLNL